MTAEMLREELFARIQPLTAAARLRGHDLHPWAPTETYSTRTACRSCGARLVVTIRPSGAEIIDTAARQNCHK